MKALFPSFFLMLATATDRQLARQVHYLKIENRILRSKLPKRISVTAGERQRLLQYGKPLGAALRALITIVSPRTFAHWLSGETNKKRESRSAGPGRPKTAEDIRALVLRLARENAWGYVRILGELKKLGVAKISRSTVIKILKEDGFEPGPRRGEGTWDDFLKRHAETLWACDFFTKKVWTMSGLVEVFVLFVIHLGSRRVRFVGMAANPDRAWMVQQARNLALIFEREPVKPKYLLRDRDGKFAPEFDGLLAAEGIKVTPVGVRAPNQNAVAERFVQSVKRECLDHFLVLGESHLRHILSEYLVYYHQHRPHQGMGNRPLGGAELTPAESGRPLGAVVCEERLGGLLRHYRRAA